MSIDILNMSYSEWLLNKIANETDEIKLLAEIKKSKAAIADCVDYQNQFIDAAKKRIREIREARQHAA